MWEYKNEYIAIGYFINNYGCKNLDEYSAKRMEQQHLSDVLNEFGKDGWELITISDELVQGRCLDGFALFKRFISNYESVEKSEKYGHNNQASG